MPEAVGDRIFLIRQALRSARDPLALTKVVALVFQRTGRRIDATELSRMERGKQRVDLEDITALAAVDPLTRGRAWLAFGDAPSVSALPPAEVASQGPVSSGLRPHNKTPTTKRRGTA
jgi:hypothetical protein